MPSPSGTDSLAKDAERNPTECDVDGEDAVDGEDESDGTESVSPVGWLGGMTRWASKLWSTKRTERLDTPHARESHESHA